MGHRVTAPSLEFWPVLPHVAQADAYWYAKQTRARGSDQPAHEREFEPIEMPKNTASASSTHSLPSSPASR